MWRAAKSPDWCIKLTVKSISPLAALIATSFVPSHAHSPSCHLSPLRVSLYLPFPHLSEGGLCFFLRLAIFCPSLTQEAQIFQTELLVGGIACVWHGRKPIIRHFLPNDAPSLGNVQSCNNLATDLISPLHSVYTSFILHPSFSSFTLILSLCSVYQTIGSIAFLALPNWPQCSILMTIEGRSLLLHADWFAEWFRS